MQESTQDNTQDNTQDDNTGETEHQKSKICEEVNAEDDNDV